MLPADFRRRHATELEAAFLDCLRRERDAPAWRRVRTPGCVWSSTPLRQPSLSAWTSDSPAGDRGASNTRDASGRHMMTSLWQDVRYATRGMRRAPVFSMVVDRHARRWPSAPTPPIFGVVNAVLLRSLPYPDRNGWSCSIRPSPGRSRAHRVLCARLPGLRTAGHVVRIDGGVQKP